MEADRLADVLLVGGYLTLICLRIFNVIAWSWLWILCPLWLPLAGALIGIIIGLMIGIPLTIYRKIRGKVNERY